MKILTVTSSARGHAIVEALSRSKEQPEIIAICANRNPGIRSLAKQMFVMDSMDFGPILEIAKKEKPEFCFIGPDDPIGAGLADELEKIGVPCVAPKKSLARIESSKGFARELMQKHGIDASPKFRVFTVNCNLDKALIEAKKLITDYIENDLEKEYVVKYDALKGGKGVKVSGEHLASVDDGVAYALECLEGCGRVVIEEKLVGVEFSVMSFTSGLVTVDMPAIQDHKRGYDGDTGPNTGGMGTYTDAGHSLPFLTVADIATASSINANVAAALQKECGEPYKGILYGGFIATKNGVKVIEYNARFGDPEALNVLPLLESDFVTLCRGIISGKLTPSMAIFRKQATVCKYIVPKSYPEKKEEKGLAVTFPQVVPENSRIYYGDISEDDDGILHLGGSRSAGVVGIGETLEEAEKIAQIVCEGVQGPVRFRSDVGTAKLIQKRVDTMKQLRK
jgi:phosphoribosylamine--glycine ligase